MNYMNHPAGVGLSDAGSTGVLEQSAVRRRWPIHFDSLERIAMATDLAAIVLASVLAGFVYHLQDVGAPIDLGKSLGSGVLVSALFILMFKIQAMYVPTALLLVRNQIRAVCLTWISVMLLLAGTVFALKIGSEISRGTSMLFAVFGASALMVNRGLQKKLLQKGLAESR